MLGPYSYSLLVYVLMKRTSHVFLPGFLGEEHDIDVLAQIPAQFAERVGIQGIVFEADVIFVQKDKDVPIRTLMGITTGARPEENQFGMRRHNGFCLGRYRFDDLTICLGGHFPFRVFYCLVMGIVPKIVQK